MYLFAFILLMVAWRYQTLSIDTFIAGIYVAMRAGVALLHRQEGANALDLTLEATVSQRFAFGAQPACSHPLSILLLLEEEKSGDWCKKRDSVER